MSPPCVSGLASYPAASDAPSSVCSIRANDASSIFEPSPAAQNEYYAAGAGGEGSEIGKGKMRGGKMISKGENEGRAAPRLEGNGKIQDWLTNRTF